MEDIAIVGIGLRFPGDAKSPEELWKVLERGESQWSEFPKDRLNIDGYYHPGGDRLGSISFRGAHFLKDDVASFDAPFFGVSADEAAAVDPQQRILLEASYEALENAGIRKEDVEGSDTAVYVGSFVKDYEQICLRDPDWQPTYAATGNGIAIMANRISYAFDFHGPSMTIDTGCSGSLVTVHMAAQSLRTGETSLALAAGAGMILTPNTIMPMTALNFLSPDGKCFTFDLRANGYGRGEGIGVVVLKRLSDAVRDNDTIRAVIRGTRVNQDGRTTGITLPSKEAQVANIRAIYKSTGLDFDQTGYVECHGTGTQAGDWRELKAVSETIASDRSVDNPIVVGSLKPNIGHLEGAAGIAGLIKGVMVLERGHIPPNINFNTPNPEIDFGNWKVKVPQKLMKWPIEGTRRASVNCFGFGGTNAHVILDEAPAYLRERGMTGNHMSVNDDHSAIINKGTKEEGPQAHLFRFSSNEKSGVQRILESQIPYVEAATGHDFLSNYSYTLNARRSNMEWKAAIVASSTTELASKMKSLDADSIVRSSSDHAKAPRICFVFCGQGSQWPKMGQGLMCFHIFRESLEAASQYMQSHLGCPFVLLDEMFRDEDESRISEPAISQPATTALQVALVELFQSLGIRPSLVVGHSSGEIAAAFAANALSREAAWEAAYYRGLHAAALPLKDPSFVGGMMAVGMSDHEAREYLINAGSKLEVACTNSPRSVTLSGEAKDIEGVASDLKSKDVFHRILPVSTAYHSQHMRLVADDYEETLTHLTPQATKGVTMFSSVTGAKVTEASFDGSYWVANMVSPVKYTQAVQEMMSNTNSERPNVFLEVSPRGIMKGPTLDILKKMGIKSTPTYLSPLDRKSAGPASVLKVIGDLWARGQQIIMKHVVSRSSSAKGLKCLTDLPPYPWNHSKAYWHESHLGKAFRFRKYPRQDLIGAHTADSIPLEPRWRGFLRLSENPWIQDHQVQKTIVYPAAGMICMVLEGMKQIADEQTDLVGYQISNMQIEKPMLIPATDHGLETALNIKLNVEDSSGATLNGSHEFVIYSKQLDGPWERNASGSLQFHYNDSPAASTSTMLEQRQDLLKSCNKAVNPRQLYELLEAVGMNYGPLFQNIVELVQSGDSCLSTIRVPDTKSKMPANFEYLHLIHPATLDSMVQTLFSIESTPMVPTLIESIFVPSVLKETRPDRFEGFSTARRTDAGARADITMAIPDSDKCPVSIKGLHLTSLAEASPGTGFLPNHHNLCTEIVWEEDAAFANPSSVAEFLGLLAFKYPVLSILQIGGTASLTLQILEILSSKGTQTPKLARLTIAKSTEGSSSLPLTLLEGSPLHAYVVETDISCLDKSLDFHLILVCRADGKIMDILPKHRKAEGYIIECDDLDSPNFKSDAVSRDLKDWPFCRSVTERCNGSFVSDSNPNGVVVLYEDGCTADVRPFALNFANDGSIKSSLDPKVSILTLNCSQQDHSVFSGKVVISMLDFSVNVKTRGFVYHWTEQQFEAFRAVQKAASGIIWITKGANMTPTDPRMSSVVALGRTLMSEDPQKAFVTVDLAAGTHLSDKHVSRLIRQIYSRTFQNSGSAPIETEYTVAGWKVYIPRLTTVDGLNNSIEGILSEAGNDTIGPMLPFYSTSRLFFGSMLKLEVVKPEVSPGCVRFVEKSCPVLQPDEIEIRFDHTLLSQSDHKAIHAGSSAVGLDFFGRVTRFGRNVRGFPPTLQVVALVSNGALQSSVIVSSKLASRCLPGFVPSYYVDAYYGLFSMGLFSGAANRKVLVISGLNGRGLAAITICQVAGIEVCTTVSGAKAEEHRAELVRLTGLSHEKILVVKFERLAKLAKAASANKGFHVVFNSTNTHNGEDGECVRPNGILVRSLDGRSEDVGSARTPDHCAVMAYSLAEVFRDEDGGQSTVESVLYNVLKLLAKKEKGFQLPEITPKAFDIQHTTDALRHVGNGNNAGAAMVLWDPENNLVRVFRPTLIKTLRRCLDPEGIYILAGGLGGLGQSIAEHLFANGARHFGFISRTGLSSPEAQNFTFSLDRRGASVTVCAADLTDGNAVSEAIERCATGDNTRRRIRGVFQCAAVIRDAVFENMTYQDWQAAFRPKAVGSLNLVNTVLDLNERPFFIFLASSAGVIGNRSQANYAAGNCFEDALARKLRMEGQHAVAIDLSPVLGAGMLAEDEKTLDILKNNGFYGIRHEDFIKVVEQAIINKPSSAADKSFPAQVTLGVGTGGLILQNQPADTYWSRTALWSHLHLVDMPPPNLATTPTDSQKDMKTLLRTAPDLDSAKQIVCTGLMHMLAKAMNMLFEEMDEHKPPTAYGVDSLVAVGVRNWVFTNCGVNVSVFEVLSDQTVGELSGLIAERAGLGEQRKESD